MSLEFCDVFKRSDLYLPGHTFSLCVCRSSVCLWRDRYFRVDEKCGRKQHITISQNQLKVCVFVCVRIASVLTIYIYIYWQNCVLDVRFAEHVIDAERYCRWCIITYTHTRAWFSSRTLCGVRYILQTPNTYNVLHHIYIIIISFIDIRFCQVLYFTLYWRRKRRSALGKIANCIYFYYIY